MFIIFVFASFQKGVHGGSKWRTSTRVTKVRLDGWCEGGLGPPFFLTRFTFFRTDASLLTIFVCFFILFNSCCSNV